MLMRTRGSDRTGSRRGAMRGAWRGRWEHIGLRPALAVLLAGLALLAPAAHAAGRVALVVGNGTYAAIGALPNPGNDAADLAAALRRLGFDVTTVRDADLAGMNGRCGCSRGRARGRTWRWCSTRATVWR